MLIILSPAKTMDMSAPSVAIPSTEAEYRTDAELLAAKMRRYSIIDLEKILKISPKLAWENYVRYQRFDDPETPVKQAILAYTGSVFQHIDPATLTSEDLDYAQSHLRIVSTLYGLVRPLDRIKAYRIAFPLTLPGMKGDLYDYWLPKLTDPLIGAVRSAGGVLINLASLDVLQALDMKRIRSMVQVVTPEFQEHRNGRYETVRTYAKMARGEMTRYILQNKTESPQQLKQFEWEGFRFNSALSDENTYVFTREKQK